MTGAEGRSGPAGGEVEHGEVGPFHDPAELLGGQALDGVEDGGPLVRRERQAGRERGEQRPQFGGGVAARPGDRLPPDGAEPAAGLFALRWFHQIDDAVAIFEVRPKRC